MLAANKKDFMKLFNELLDPRMDEKLTYPLEEILFLVLAAVLSGAESWRKIILYGNKKLKLLRKFLPFKDGLPSRHTLMTVFGLLDKKHLERWLLSWTSDYLGNLERRYGFSNPEGYPHGIADELLEKFQEIISGW